MPSRVINQNIYVIFFYCNVGLTLLTFAFFFFKIPGVVSEQKSQVSTPGRLISANEGCQQTSTGTLQPNAQQDGSRKR